MSDPYVTVHEVSRAVQRAVLVGFIAVVARPILAFKPALDSLLSVAIPTMVVLLVAGFRRLTVSVSDEEVTCAFGHGWPRRRVPLSQIESVSTRRLGWVYVWGIRLAPQGWLWRAAGRDTVCLHLATGRNLYLGVEDPAALADQIRRRF